MKKIGIIGGTFNPIHIGHLMLGEWVRESLGLHQILYVPTGCSYTKNTNEIRSGAERLHMVNLAIKENPYFASDDIEINREGNTYTYETMVELKKRNPENQYYFVVGADCLFSIESWKCPDKIFENCTLVVVNRNGIREKDFFEKKKELEQKYSICIEYVSFPQIDISSTKIRENCRKEMSIRYMVPKEVEEYIISHNLYVD